MGFNKHRKNAEKAMKDRGNTIRSKCTELLDIMVENFSFPGRVIAMAETRADYWEIFLSDESRNDFPIDFSKIQEKRLFYPSRYRRQEEVEQSHQLIPADVQPSAPINTHKAAHDIPSYIPTDASALEGSWPGQQSPSVDQDTLVSSKMSGQQHVDTTVSSKWPSSVQSPAPATGLLPGSRAWTHEATQGHTTPWSQHSRGQHTNSGDEQSSPTFQALLNTRATLPSAVQSPIFTSRVETKSPPQQHSSPGAGFSGHQPFSPAKSTAPYRASATHSQTEHRPPSSQASPARQSCIGNMVGTLPAQSATDGMATWGRLHDPNVGASLISQTSPSVSVAHNSGPVSPSSLLLKACQSPTKSPTPIGGSSSRLNPTGNWATAALSIGSLTEHQQSSPSTVSAFVAKYRQRREQDMPRWQSTPKGGQREHLADWKLRNSERGPPFGRSRVPPKKQTFDRGIRKSARTKPERR